MSTFFPKYRAVLHLCRRQCSPGDYLSGHVGAMTLKSHIRAVVYALQRMLLSTFHLWQAKQATTLRTTRSMKIKTISNIEYILRHMQVNRLPKDHTICVWKRTKTRRYKTKIRGLKFESCTTSRSWRTNDCQATQLQSRLMNEADLKYLL